MTIISLYLKLQHCAYENNMNENVSLYRIHNTPGRPAPFSLLFLSLSLFFPLLLFFYPLLSFSFYLIYIYFISLGFLPRFKPEYLACSFISVKNKGIGFMQNKMPSYFFIFNILTNIFDITVKYFT